jgi:hypothetical protein
MFDDMGENLGWHTVRIQTICLERLQAIRAEV